MPVARSLAASLFCAQEDLPVLSTRHRATNPWPYSETLFKDSVNNVGLMQVRGQFSCTMWMWHVVCELRMASFFVLKGVLLHWTMV